MAVWARDRARTLLVVAVSALGVAVAIAVNLATGGEIPAALAPARPWLWHIVAALTVLSAYCSVLLLPPDREARRFRTVIDLLEAEQLQDNSFAEYREGMLERVGVVVRDQLAPLRHASVLQLELEDAPAAVGQSRPAIGDSDALAAFDAEEGSLLVLGEPGAGKSVLLTQLAAELLDRALGQTDQPIPVLIPLAEWKGQRRRWWPRFRRFSTSGIGAAAKTDDHDEQPVDLGPWLVWYLKRRYRIRPDVGRRWIAQHKLALLFDGLDEVPPVIRNKCARQLDSVVVHEKCPPVVITCRSEHYSELAKVIRLRRALTIKPLAKAQVLSSLGVDEQGLRDALSDDPALSELLDSPLWLHLARSIHHDLPGKAVVRRAGHGYRTHKRLMAAYLNELLEHRSRYPPGRSTKILRWLVQLARLSGGDSSAKVSDLRQVFGNVELPIAAHFVARALFLGPLTAAALVVGALFPAALRFDLLSGVLLLLPLLLLTSIVVDDFYKKAGLPPNPLRLRRVRSAVGSAAGAAVGVILGLAMDRLAGLLLVGFLELPMYWSQVVAILGVLALASAGWFTSSVVWRLATTATGVVLCGFVIASSPQPREVGFGVALGMIIGTLIFTVFSTANSASASEGNGKLLLPTPRLAIIVFGAGSAVAFFVAVASGAPFMAGAPWFLIGLPVGLLLSVIPGILVVFVLAPLLEPLLRRITYGWLGILPIRSRPFLRELVRIGLVNRSRGQWQF